MKFLACFALFATLAVVSVNALAGQSACRDPTEVHQKFPHHWDPSKYWYCEQLNENAVERDCPKDTAYMHLLKECIPWPNWVWKKPENPPTVA
ncbi:uncharacterized protein LOC106083132 [Stomoxys calcitrans]|uniref:Chitin-binding type-2 domain-containing protein n=1 Tax=Stomoxys calcitrans TaxID=35570 RepID=A0A1I8Q6L4_STOCA|nr:uncharacterized protein LOC106083132 [Stomoxys calcitrans]